MYEQPEIRDLAAIGDGRTVALVDRRGTIPWLCLPDLDGEAAFAALLDPAGGRFELAPDVPSTVTRYYLDGTNVLETTFRTADGEVAVRDALVLPDGNLPAQRELVREVRGIAGRVPMRWLVEPRLGFGLRPQRSGARSGVPVITSGSTAVGVVAAQAGDPETRDGAIHGRFDARAGERALLALVAAHREPLVLPPPRALEQRLGRTVETWRAWSDGRPPAPRWSEALLRSGLALKLLVYVPSGAIAAAATTSLPEALGGERNWDYRLSWPRDSALAIEAFVALDCPDEARSYFSWLLHASQTTRPELRPLYRLNGRAGSRERELPLAGYRGSRPVRVGNAAASQVQLDVYGEVIRAAWSYHEAGYGLDREQADRIAGMADHVAGHWSRPDAGIWEVRGDPRHFTHSKMLCVVALERAEALGEAGLLRPRPRWREIAREARAFVESRCVGAAGDYVRAAGEDEPDAALLLALLAGYGDPTGPRWRATVARIERELADGPLVRRYRAGDGLESDEGAFLACSFWLAQAYLAQGRREEARGLLDDLVALANDVGLYAEEIDPRTGAFLGNTPQALVHLGLVCAVRAYADAEAAA